MAQLSPLALIKFALWVVAVVVATVLLRRRRVSATLRFVYLLLGTLLFGFLFGLLTPQGALDPNPVFAVRNLFGTLFGARPAAAQMATGARPPVGPAVGMLVVLLALVWVSNKSICGWGCPLGLLQDLLHRVPFRKYKPSFRLSNGVRVVAFALLLGGLASLSLDWIGLIDPFQIFKLDMTLAIGIFVGLLLLASLFTYRPWCQFLCPFGLLGWVVEQFSLLRPRIDRSACRECQLCVKACPSQAMADIYAGKALHADCYACGACLAACPFEGALGWRGKLSSGQSKKED